VPGIHLIFEAAPRDSIYPAEAHLTAGEADFHLEMLATWNDDAPEGFPVGGHVPYLVVSAKILNEQTKDTVLVELTPHLNLVDGFHYARNIKLPGAAEDLYSLEFSVVPPAAGSLGLHSDWLDEFGDTLHEALTFEFREVDLKAVVYAQR
jgi:uncharacterized protein involved in high-affinity Fe2+ transport